MRLIRRELAEKRPRTGTPQHRVKAAFEAESTVSGRRLKFGGSCKSLLYVVLLWLLACEVRKAGVSLIRNLRACGLGYAESLHLEGNIGDIGVHKGSIMQGKVFTQRIDTDSVHKWLWLW